MNETAPNRRGGGSWGVGACRAPRHPNYNTIDHMDADALPQQDADKDGYMDTHNDPFRDTFTTGNQHTLTDFYTNGSHFHGFTCSDANCTGRHSLTAPHYSASNRIRRLAKDHLPVNIADAAAAWLLWGALTFAIFAAGVAFATYVYREWFD